MESSKLYRVITAPLGRFTRSFNFFKISTFILSILGLFLLIGLSASPLAWSQQDRVAVAIQEAETRALRAFQGLQRADQAGADTADIDKEFNGALSLLDEAKREASYDGLGAFESAGRAAGIFNDLQFKARLVEGSALGQAGDWRVSIYASVPVVAVLASIAAYFFSKWWRRFDLDRTLEMEIEPVG